MADIIRGCEVIIECFIACAKVIRHIAQKPKERVPICLGLLSGCAILVFGLPAAFLVISNTKWSMFYSFEISKGIIYYYNNTDAATNVVYNNTYFCSYYAISIDCQNRATLSCDPNSYNHNDYDNQYISIDRTSETDTYWVLLQIFAFISELFGFVIFVILLMFIGCIYCANGGQIPCKGYPIGNYIFYGISVTVFISSTIAFIMGFTTKCNDELKYYVSNTFNFIVTDMTSNLYLSMYLLICLLTVHGLIISYGFIRYCRRKQTIQKGTRLMDGSRDTYRSAMSVNDVEK
eukprot:387654_1